MKFRDPFHGQTDTNIFSHNDTGCAIAVGSMVQKKHEHPDAN